VADGRSGVCENRRDQDTGASLVRQGQHPGNAKKFPGYSFGE
jgi:hypothetical protein